MHTYDCTCFANVSSALPDITTHLPNVAAAFSFLELVANVAAAASLLPSNNTNACLVINILRTVLRVSQTRCGVLILYTIVYTIRMYFDSL